MYRDFNKMINQVEWLHLGISLSRLDLGPSVRFPL